MGQQIEIRNLKVQASLYKNKYDNVPKPFVGTLPELIGERHVVSTEKDGPALSFAVYEDGKKRANENVKAIYAIGFDLDDADVETVKNITARFAEQNLARVIHTSFSNRLPGKGDRIRIICIFSRPVNVEEYKHIWDYFHAMADQLFDEAARDPSRMLYLPRVHPDVQKYAAIKFFDGEFIDVEEILKKEIPKIEIEVKERKNSKKKKRGRNNILTSLAGKLRSEGATKEDIEAALLDENSNLKNPLDEKEVKSIAKSVAKYKNGKKTQGSDSLVLAEEFLNKVGVPIIQINSDFFKFNGSHYSEVNPSLFKSQVVSFLQEENEIVTGVIVSNILLNISGLCSHESKQVPFAIDPQLHGRSLLPMQNGLLDIRKAMNKDPDALLVNNGGYFALGATNYPYDPSATCPIWLNEYLHVIQPDEEMRSFLQEVMGYTLLPDFNLGKFFILLGEGANGKSVYVLVSQLLVGVGNVSSVPLESMSLTRTFPLWEMVGKFLNVAEEIGEIEKSEEGLLKNIVTGGRICIERKYRDASSTQLGTKLFFCANNPPRFSDKSSGIWRRMVSIPFSIQILDEAKQNINFVNADWWNQSGELPGVLNWALEGLKRLVERGHFKIPSACMDFCGEYRLESNPAASFLHENCVEKVGSRITTKSLYNAYSAWCKELGFHPLNANGFAREVSRIFRGVTCSKNAQRLGNDRSRVWEGISLCDR